MSAAQLFEAAYELLDARYSDGEVDAYAMGQFADAVHRLSASIYGCAHVRTVRREGDETFKAQIGCLDCNAWLTPTWLKEKS